MMAWDKSLSLDVPRLEAMAVRIARCRARIANRTSGQKTGLSVNPTGKAISSDIGERHP